MSNSSTGESFFEIFTKIKVQTLLLFANHFDFWVIISCCKILEFSKFSSAPEFDGLASFRLVRVCVRKYFDCRVRFHVRNLKILAQVSGMLNCQIFLIV